MNDEPKQSGHSRGRAISGNTAVELNKSTPAKSGNTTGELNKLSSANSDNTAVELQKSSSAYSGNTAVQLINVSFAYRSATSVVHNCSMQITSGRILALLGPNGSGKTTLLKLIAGALIPDSGEIARHGRTGYVPQFLQLSFAYSVLDVVLMGRAQQVGVFATPSRADVAAAYTALERLELQTFASRSFDELSGGERQLVAFARAIASDAKILVLDEPTSSLDLRHQQTVLRWIRRLAREDGLTVVFSTHQPQHADVVADDVALIQGPGNIDVGRREDMLRAERVSALFGVRIARTGEHGVIVTDWEL